MRYSKLALSLFAAVPRVSSGFGHGRLAWPGGGQFHSVQLRPLSLSAVGSTTSTSSSTEAATNNVRSIPPPPQRQKQQQDRGRLFPEELNILYDSRCNVCQLEIDFLRNRDVRLHGPGGRRLKFTDLESGSYDGRDPANGGIDYGAGMRAMHGILPDGRVLRGVPVFLAAYEEVKLGWLFGMYNVPALKWLLDRSYDVFATHRTTLTRGTHVSDLVEAYRTKRELMEASKDERQACETCAAKVSS
jgi:predicted DCC family thiol-disulfide oxidoreductase YuxK